MKYKLWFYIPGISFLFCVEAYFYPRHYSQNEFSSACEELAGRLNAEFSHADHIDDDGEKLEL